MILQADNCFILLREIHPHACTHAHERNGDPRGQCAVGCDRVDSERASAAGWTVLALSVVVTARPQSLNGQLTSD